VLKTAAVPPRKSSEATSDSWASINSAPSLRRRLPRAATPTTGSVAIDSRVSVAPVLGSVPVYRLPWQIDGAPVPITRRAPLLGEHNDYTLNEVLGYPDERVTALREAGLFS